MVFPLLSYGDCLNIPRQILLRKFYSNVDPVLRQAIDTIPTGDWLRTRIVGKKRIDTE